MKDLKSISILGSTGSVGRSTVDIVSAYRDKFSVRCLTAHRNLDLLVAQAHQFKPDVVAIGDITLFPYLKKELAGIVPTILGGPEGIEEAAAIDVDWTMAAIVGMAGLKPILQAVRKGKAVAIANKEPLVSAGALLMQEAKKHGTVLLPVDSEHNAIFQVFEKKNHSSIRRIVLTASGGPFRTWTREEMQAATPAQAVTHPNWSMGAKISVDSASMMNKGLEVIEAHYLFNMPSDKIDVLIHPQSIVHSMVEYEDGSVLAQLGAPDMRTPIAVALAWPDRMATTGQTLDWEKMSSLDFTKPDHKRFPCLQLAYDSLNSGASACVALNAANEVAVAEFLNGRIGFCDIERLIRNTVDKHEQQLLSSLDEILAYDLEIRNRVNNAVSRNYIGHTL